MFSLSRIADRPLNGVCEDVDGAVRMRSSGFDATPSHAADEIRSRFVYPVSGPCDGERKTAATRAFTDRLVVSPCSAKTELTRYFLAQGELGFPCRCSRSRIVSATNAGTFMTSTIRHMTRQCSLESATRCGPCTRQSTRPSGMCLPMRVTRSFCFWSHTECGPGMERTFFLGHPSSSWCNPAGELAEAIRAMSGRSFNGSARLLSGGGCRRRYRNPLAPLRDAVAQALARDGALPTVDANLSSSFCFVVLTALQ